ncbi:MAG: SDR family NAD(P)-dependent oxidoreductase, partial [Thermoplasmatota archaeon]
MPDAPAPTSDEHALAELMAKKQKRAAGAAPPAPAVHASPEAAPPPVAAATPPSGASGAGGVKDALLALVAEKTGYPTDVLALDMDMEADLGIDTVKQAEVFGAIRDRYHLPREEGIQIKDYPTLGHVIGYVEGRLTHDGERMASAGSDAAARGPPIVIPAGSAVAVSRQDPSPSSVIIHPSPVVAPAVSAVSSSTPSSTEFETAPVAHSVAIVGLGCVLPRASNPAAFWRFVLSKESAIGDVPRERWDPAIYYDPDPAAPDKTYAKIGAFITDFTFDPLPFRIPPNVARSLDEVQKWVLVAAKQALDDYGKEFDRARTAVILGNSMGGENREGTTSRVLVAGFADEMRQAGADPALIARAVASYRSKRPPITEDSMPGELSNVVAGRVAQVFNLSGKNFTTDAACASSLAALDAAVRALVSHECDVVLAGGADRSMDVATYVKFAKIGALSAKGSFPFDARADGFVMGEGAAIFVLKRLEDAIRAKDRIYAVIRGVGSSSDGKGKSITAPNPAGQKHALSRALHHAELAPRHVQLIECHGTSTKVGDVVEVETLAATYTGSLDSASLRKIRIGSVKSQIGHLKSGAGAASLLKVALALANRTLPPSANFATPNPNIAWDRVPFEVQTRAEPWPEPARGEPRRATVNAFGFGGTNFSAIVEEYVPAYHARLLGGGAGAAQSQPRDVDGQLAREYSRASAAPAVAPAGAPVVVPAPLSVAAWPVHADAGVVVLRASDAHALAALARDTASSLAGGGTSFASLVAAPSGTGASRIAIAATAATLGAQLALAADSLPDERKRSALPLKAIFYGEGARSGKVAFLFPGQGSQYANMLAALASRYPIVRETFEEADRVLLPALGKKLTSLIFVDAADKAAVARAEEALKATEVCQPAMLAGDVALYRLLVAHGLEPDAVAGHSLGEYAALVAAGSLTFAQALEAVAARGAEMAHVSVPDLGKMAGVSADAPTVEAVLKDVSGYVIAANKNCPKQTVIAGESPAVDAAVKLFLAKGIDAQFLNVSAAFHSAIVAPASAPLKRVLERLDFKLPSRELISNVTAEPYPPTREAAVELLSRQVAAPVEWQRSLERLHHDGVRIFVEVGPKRALAGFVDATFGRKADAVVTNHPKLGDVNSWYQALARLTALGCFESSAPLASREVRAPLADAATRAPSVLPTSGARASPSLSPPIPATGFWAEHATELQSFLGAIEAKHAATSAAMRDAVERAAHLGLNLDRVVISGAAIGLPGRARKMFDDGNFERLFRGENAIDALTDEEQRRFLDKNIVKLVKSANGEPVFESIHDASQVIKLAAKKGDFDLTRDFGMPAALVESFDTTFALAFAAGIDALRDAGLPLVREDKVTSKGHKLPGGWEFPTSMRDETGVIFASAFPGYDNLVQEVSRHLARKYGHAAREDLLALYTSLIERVGDPKTRGELTEWFARHAQHLGAPKGAENLEGFNRKFLFRVLSFAHAQFAEAFRIRGPNAQVNAACASTTLAVSMAEDWIRAGRAKRVVIIAADDATSDHLFEWIGSGFLASGAATTEKAVENAALPFDRRRHGMIVGMGAVGLVVETVTEIEKRGIAPIAELVATQISNSAFHGSRLDVDHIASEMERLVRTVEKRTGLAPSALARDTIFVSHETYTPARGGSASAEIAALRRAFGASVGEVLVANTKGFHGHPMGASLEDAIAVKSLQYNKVPPVANLREIDPEFKEMQFSRGGVHDRKYALRLAAGFGSQLAFFVVKKVADGDQRIVDPARHQAWLDRLAGRANARLEVVNRTLRVIDERAAPATSGAATPVPQPVPVAPPELRPHGPPPGAVAVVKDALLAIVAEKTGYPPEMLQLDMDMEADLGIDTVKQAEVFGAIRDRYQLPREEGIQIKDYPTLAHVIRYIEGRVTDNGGMMASAGSASVAGGGAIAPGGPRPAASAASRAAVPVVQAVTPRIAATARAPSVAITPASSSPSSSVAASDVLAAVRAIVAEKTGYPVEALEADLDLEADLGIDTVKQAEIFGLLREKYSIPRNDDLQLKDYNTLAKVASYFAAAPVATLAPSQTATILTEPARPRGSDVQRLVPVVVEAPLPARDAFLAGKRVHVMGRAPASLTRRLEAAGATLSDSDYDVLIAHAGTLAEARSLFLLAKTHEARLSKGGLLMLTANGGHHATRRDPQVEPASGAFTGLTKGLAREWPAARVRALDVARDIHEDALGDAIVEELSVAGANVEVGRLDGKRVAVAVAVARSPDRAAVSARAPTHVLLSGGGRGIAAECARALAATGPGWSFTLLGRSALAADAAPLAALDDVGWSAKKADAKRALDARGERATPVKIEKEIAPLVAAADIHRTLVALRAAGARAEYRACDVADADALAVVVREARAAFGPVGLVVHAAGFEESKRLADKTEESWDATFAPKVAGLFALDGATRADVPRFILFGSVAGRFGNAMQADYSAANDLLAKFSASRTNASVIDWSAWSGVGMATRGSTLTVLAAIGVEALSTIEGTTAFVDEVASPSGAPVIVIAKALAQLAPRIVEAPDARGSTVTLAPDQLFLKDHAIAGTPVLPGVMG